MSERDSTGQQTFTSLRAGPELTLLWRVPLDCSETASGNVDQAGTVAAIITPGGHSIGLFDLKTRAFRRPLFQPSDPDMTIHSAAVRSDGQQVAGGFQDGTLAFWKSDSPTVFRTVRPHHGLVQDLSWSLTGDAIASAAFGNCGWLKNDCAVVTRLDGDQPVSHVVWSHRFHAPGSLAWLEESKLLLMSNNGIYVVPSGLNQQNSAGSRE